MTAVYAQWSNLLIDGAIAAYAVALVALAAGVSLSRREPSSAPPIHRPGPSRRLPRGSQ